MSPKISSRRIASSAYVPPSTRPLTTCWSSASTASAAPLLLHEVRQRDLAVLHLHQEDAGVALAALLAGRAVLLELDRAVEARDVHLPQRVAHGLGIVLAGDAERRGDGGDAVVTAEALGEALERIAA